MPGWRGSSVRTSPLSVSLILTSRTRRSLFASARAAARRRFEGEVHAAIYASRVRRGVVGAAFAVCLAVGGCEFPRDVEGTLDRVEGGTMRVGVVHHPPWVDLSGSAPAGVEVELVERFADEIGTEIEYFEGTESELAEDVPEGLRVGDERTG
jgi:hypothetical protein